MVRSGKLWRPATLCVACGALLALLAVTRQIAEAKAPGEAHCYKTVCHRVLSLAEVEALVGRTLQLTASHYDHPLVDPMNTGEFTSSGERFDADSPTSAASSNLPDGTELLVRNPANGRVSHIRVNDFGPFHKDRTLDVTRRVARHGSDAGAVSHRRACPCSTAHERV